MRQEIADIVLNTAWLRCERLAGSRERALQARADKKLREAEQLNEYISGGGAFIGWFAQKHHINKKHLLSALAIAAALGVVGSGIAVGVKLHRNKNTSQELASVTTGQSQSDPSLIYTAIDDELCAGVAITGNPVKVRPEADPSSESIGEVYSTDNITYPYLGEKQGTNGVRWFSIQYRPDRTGWVSSEYSRKVYVMPEDDNPPELDRIAESYSAMGAQVALIHKGHVVNQYAYGWAELGKSAMTTDTAIRSASLSKVALAMLAFDMQEEGKLDMNRNISEQWGIDIRNPAYPDVPITLNTLFSETAGFVYIDSAGLDRQKAADLLISNNSFYPEKEPGKAESWSYSNFGINVAGTTMELSAGVNLVPYSERRFSDFGITASFAGGDLAGIVPIAALYNKAHIEARSVEEQTSKKAGSDIGDNISSWAGGLTISAGDMAKLIAILAADGMCYDAVSVDSFTGTEFLTSDSVNTMETRLFVVNDSESNSTFEQALPMRYIENAYGQSRLYYHTGNAYGVLSIAAYNPDTGDGVVVITTGAQEQRDEHGIYKVCADLMQYGFNIFD